MENPHPLKIEDGALVASTRDGQMPLPMLSVSDRKLFVFTQEWTQHQPSIRAYLASFLGNSIAVDDALQEVALIVWQKGPWDVGSSAFLGYCLACARRIALAARRKRGDKRMEWLSPNAATILADRVAFLEQQETWLSGDRVHALRLCLEKIKPEHRDLLDARYSGDSKDELREISKHGNKSMDALYKTLERLRELLRACVERGQHNTE